MEDVKRTHLPLGSREVDAATLKAFAHPLRMRMYDWLKDHGAGTASMLAEAMGESTGQTSYHLRQLEKHGLVAEDSTRGTARERWWEAQGFSYGLDTIEADPETLTTVQLVMRQGAEARYRRQLEFIERQVEEAREWQEVVTFNEFTTRLTPDELEAITKEVFTVLEEHLARAKARRREDGGVGTRMVKMYAQYFPLPPDA